jgi:hypothetical protein
MNTPVFKIQPENVSGNKKFIWRNVSGKQTFIQINVSGNQTFIQINVRLLKHSHILYKLNGFGSEKRKTYAVHICYIIGSDTHRFCHSDYNAQC